MSGSKPPGEFWAAVSRAAGYGRDASAALAAGGTLAYLTPLAANAAGVPLDGWHAFLAGFFAVAAGLAFYRSTFAHAEAEFDHIKRLRESGRISDALYERLRAKVLDWFVARRYGGKLPPADPPPPGEPPSPPPVF